MLKTTVRQHSAAVRSHVHRLANRRYVQRAYAAEERPCGADASA